MGRAVAAEAMQLLDLHPADGDLVQEVLDGLSRPIKELPCKLFYDERGSALYEEICKLEEYYLTRTETSIMQANVDQIVSLLGPRCLLIEYGSGSSEKTRILLSRLEEVAAYIPVDISRDRLLQAAAEIAADYPDLEVLPVCADYTAPFELPEISEPVSRRVVYYPGSSIGNFDKKEAVSFLGRVAALCEPGDVLLLGADLKKDRAVLEAAYNDASGVTAEFNLNMLRHLNNRLGADFDLEGFSHRALYNDVEGRIEMHLVSLTDQSVQVDGVAVHFEEGETIWTESSYKYDREDVAELTDSAGFEIEKVWTDPDHFFSVQYLSVGNGSRA